MTELLHNGVLSYTSDQKVKLIPKLILAEKRLSGA